MKICNFIKTRFIYVITIECFDPRISDSKHAKLLSKRLMVLILVYMIWN